MAEQSVGERLRALRGRVSQRELARRIEFSAAHVSLVERGECQPSERFLKAAAEALGYPDFHLIPEIPRPKKTRPRLRGKMKEVHRHFGRRQVLPVRGGRLEHAFAEVRWCSEGAALVAALDSLRRPGPFWVASKTIARGLTAPEQGAWLQFLLPDGELQELHPHEVRFPFPVVEVPGRCPHGILIPKGEALVSIHEQVTFLPVVHRVRRLDFLVSAAFEDVVARGNVEIDGPTHASMKRADRVRQDEIGLPFLRIRAAEVYRSDFRAKVLDWILEHLRQECERRGKPVPRTKRDAVEHLKAAPKPAVKRRVST